MRANWSRIVVGVAAGARRALAGCLLALVGCAAPIELPPQFLVLQGDTFRAVTGDDARLWVRDFEEPNVASLEFWGEALRYDLCEQRGYELVGRGEVRSRGGDLGQWFEFAANVHGQRTGYLIAFWVDGARIRTVEFAAADKAFRAQVDGVRAALATTSF